MLKVISWIVRGFNCPVKRGDVKWVLRRFASNIAILQESKLKVVSRHNVVFFFGGVVIMLSGCFCHQWAVLEVLSLFGTLMFWSFLTLESSLFLCAASPWRTILFEVLLGFMTL